ncbi:MAG: hypothetical protein ABSA30_06435, partial [Candidatus Aminicenantales bacterium]
FVGLLGVHNDDPVGGPVLGTHSHQTHRHHGKLIHSIEMSLGIIAKNPPQVNNKVAILGTF